MFSVNLGCSLLSKEVANKGVARDSRLKNATGILVVTIKLLLGKGRTQRIQRVDKIIF